MRKMGDGAEEGAAFSDAVHLTGFGAGADPVERGRIACVSGGGGAVPNIFVLENRLLGRKTSVALLFMAMVRFCPFFDILILMKS